MKLKTNMKQKLGFLLMVIMIMVVSITAIPDTVYASKILQLTTIGEVAKSGKYIYFTYRLCSSKKGIYRYDTAAQKLKKIVDDKYNRSATNGFNYLNVTDKYVIAEWDIGYGSDDFCMENYIYRFSKDGKSKKKLATGAQPIVIGKYIYYIDEKLVNESGNKFTKPTGYVCRMKLDGTGKKKVKKVDLKGNLEIQGLYKKGRTLYYCYYMSDDLVYCDLKGHVYKDDQVAFTNYLKPQFYSIKAAESVTKDNYTYFISGDGCKVYKKNVKTGKKSTIVKGENWIASVRFVGKYLLVETSGMIDEETNGTILYILKQSGKGKKKLLTWRGVS